MIGGVCKSTALCGTVLGMGFVTILRELLTHHDMYQWGWRIPFLSSFILGVIGLYLRYNLHESEEFMKVKNRGLTDSTRYF
jgi:MHS family proline/betaine transporter-like MFS transporter